MDTLLIKKLLKSFKCFKGVYPSNLIPQFKTLPINIIVNTDPSYKKGEHWVAISINKHGFGEYFDSFGFPPLKEDIFNFMESMCFNGWIYNKTVLQNVTSITCGNYCVLYIIFRCQDLSTDMFLSKFSKDTITNDILIDKIFKNFSFVKKILLNKD